MLILEHSEAPYRKHFQDEKCSPIDQLSFAQTFIKKMKIGQCYYVPLIDDNAGMINDPVLLKITENKYWFSVADSDVLLWAKGLAIGLNLDIKVVEPEIYPLAIQGPLAENLMIDIFGLGRARLNDPYCL